MMSFLRRKKAETADTIPPQGPKVGLSERELATLELERQRGDILRAEAGKKIDDFASILASFSPKRSDA